MSKSSESGAEAASGDGQVPRFETALQGLDKAVQELEGGSLSLDEALLRYEEGVRLVRQCQQMLDEAAKKVAKLTGVGEDGQPVTEAFVDLVNETEVREPIRTERATASRARPSAAKPLARRQSPGVFDTGGEEASDPPF
jgi:exodeoxyribonuclease VII small subunit